MRWKQFFPLANSLHEPIAFFLVLPFILTVVFFLPSSLKNTYFILNSMQPNIASAFLSNYTHSDSYHILNNISIYLIAMFLIFNLETDRNRFYTTAGLIFLILPWIISVLTIQYIPNSTANQGLSGLGAALLGYLVYSIYAYLKHKAHININLSFVILAFTANALIVSIINIGLSTVSYVAIAVLAAEIFLNRNGIHQTVRW